MDFPESITAEDLKISIGFRSDFKETDQSTAITEINTPVGRRRFVCALPISKNPTEKEKEQVLEIHLKAANRSLEKLRKEHEKC